MASLAGCPLWALPIHCSVEKMGFLPACRGAPCLLFCSCFYHGPEWELCLAVLGDVRGCVAAPCGTGFPHH